MNIEREVRVVMVWLAGVVCLVVDSDKIPLLWFDFIMRHIARECNALQFVRRTRLQNHPSQGGGVEEVVV